MTLPFLTPLIPPMGISCLKSFLQSHGYEIKIVDGMADIELRRVCYQYFDTLESFVPEKKKGHYFNVALDVLYNQFMAHINYIKEKDYIELIKLLVYRNFFMPIDEEQALGLKKIVDNFYLKLEGYLVDLFEKENPTHLGLSVYKGTLAASVFTGRLVKRKYPHIKVVMGGAIFSQDLFPGTPNYEVFLEKESFIEKVFIGESEILFLKYLQGALPGNKKMYTVKDINDQLVVLDSLRVPDYSDFDLSAYPLLPAYTSRGCIYRCSFCAETVFWKSYHRKSAEKVADDLIELSGRYGRNIFVLTDCLINPLVTEFSEELIRRGLKIYWDVYIKVDKRVCEPANTLQWRKGGFYRARLGIESGSQRMLDLINKKISLQEIKAAISSLASVGIKTSTYWIAGHPGETEEDFKQTLVLLEELQDDLYEAECDPFRFFYKGQVDSGVWNEKSLLYPEDKDNLLLTQTWILDNAPPREVIYERECRFREHCKKLGIPNPYSMGEIREADRRWSQLHKNSVPSLVELNSGHQDLDKIREIDHISAVDNSDVEYADFSF